MSSMLPYMIILLLAVFVSCLSQVLLKKAALRHYDSRWKFYLNPLVIGAYLVFFVVTWISVYAYRGLPLSLGAVLEASGYFYVMVLGRYFFGEPVTKQKVLGVLLIVAGIFVFVSESEG